MHDEAGKVLVWAKKQCRSHTVLDCLTIYAHFMVILIVFFPLGLFFLLLLPCVTFWALNWNMLYWVLNFIVYSFWRSSGFLKLLLPCSLRLFCINTGVYRYIIRVPINCHRDCRKFYSVFCICRLKTWHYSLRRSTKPY